MPNLAFKSLKNELMVCRVKVLNNLPTTLFIYNLMSFSAKFKFLKLKIFNIFFK